MKEAEGRERRRRWKRRLLSIGAAAAGALGFGGTVACAYGPGFETSCTSTTQCRTRMGAGYYCDKPDAGNALGYCAKRTHFDQGSDSPVADQALPPDKRPPPDRQRDLARPDRQADRARPDNPKSDRNPQQ